MAITQNTFTGNGSNLGPFSFTFKWLEPTDIKVTVGGVLKTAGTHYNLQALNYTTKDGGQVLFTAGNAPANGAAIVIYRQTDDADLVSTFYSGSAIRAQDLNDNFTQILYVSQETQAFAASTDASAIQATANTALVNSNQAITTANAASTTANGIAATANTALSNSTSAVNAANAALPKAGGTMTGDITFNGTQTFPASGIQDGTTVQKGIVQLTDSTSSTSTTTAATPNSVKTSYDLANAAMPKSGGTFTGNIIVPSINGGQLAGTRNRIINGDMRISQRGTSFATLDPAALAYTLDRFYFGGGNTGARATISQSSDVPSAAFSNSLRVQVTTADSAVDPSDRAHIQQVIEGFNIVDLVGTAFTLSFWVKSPKAGVHCVSFQNAGAPADRSFVAEYTVTTANEWEYKTITVSGGLTTAGTWNYANGVGLRILFALMAGSTFHSTSNTWVTGNFHATSSQVNVFDSNANNFYITGVQLEPGTVATPFERRSYGQELALCQRYFQNLDVSVFLDQNNYSLGTIIKYPVIMRATPTINPTGAANYTDVSTGAKTGTYINTNVNTSAKAYDRSNNSGFVFKINKTTANTFEIVEYAETHTASIEL